MTEKQKSKKGWLVALVLLLTLAIAANVWQWVKKPSESAFSNESLVNEAALEADSIIESLRFENNLAIEHIDSLEQELSYWKNELDIVKSQANTGNLSNSERNRLLGRISNLRNRIAAFAYKEQLLDSMTSMNLAYEISIAQKEDSISKVLNQLDTLNQNVTRLSASNEDLNNTLDKAGQPKYSALTAYGKDNKRKGVQTTFDASKVEEFIVQFSLIGSSFFKGKSNQELKVRVLGPEGQLYQKGGSIIEKPRSEDFTFYESFDYTGQNEKFDLKFTPLKKMSKGKYIIELIANGQVIQEKRFTLH
jgi:hypothetical protein